MHICRPFYKIMDSSNYIMHANDLRAGWQCSANIRIVKTKNDHDHSPSNLASPVAATMRAWARRIRLEMRLFDGRGPRHSTITSVRTDLTGKLSKHVYAPDLGPKLPS